MKSYKLDDQVELFDNVPYSKDSDEANFFIFMES